MKKLSPLREFNYGTAREEVAVEKKRYSTPEFGTHVLPSGRFRLGSAGGGTAWRVRRNETHVMWCVRG